MKKFLKPLVALFVVLLAVLAVSTGCNKKVDLKIIDPVSIPETENIPDGTLVYYENFDDSEELSRVTQIVNEFGYRVLSKSVHNAYSDNSTKYKIQKYKDGKALHLENNTENGTDSYFEILSSVEMGYFHESNYTVQYDVEYEEAANAARYIALVNGYGDKFYYSFILQNSGLAKYECHNNGTWYSLDNGAASAIGKDSVSYKLIGKEYVKDEQTLKGVSISVRHVVDWQNGGSVYVRVNDSSLNPKGEWVLITKTTDTSDGSSYWNTDCGSAALVLKTGGKQNGFVDNIMVWTGTGDEPADKSNVYLKNSNKKVCKNHVFDGSDCNVAYKCKYCETELGSDGHVFKDNKSTTVCERCGVSREYLEYGWIMTDLPIYKGGEKSKYLYKDGQGIETEWTEDNESKMITVSATTTKQFNKYCKTLESSGYKKTFDNSRDKNIYKQYSNGENQVYLYFVEATKEARIILDKSSDVTVDSFGYSYEKNNGEKTTLYQIGLPYKTNKNDGLRVNCGMMYMIKLADNSLIVIDGGDNKQFDDKQIDETMKLMRDVTGAGQDGKVRIASWYITHGHTDHIAGFARLLKKYNSDIDIERIMFNFPTTFSTATGNVDHKNVYKKLTDYINEWYKDDLPVFIKLHTGQSFDLADVKVDVLYTHEDIVNPESSELEIEKTFNNTSLVTKFTIDGKSFIVLGDIDYAAMQVVQKINSADVLKSDIVQIGHHALNYLNDIYEVISAEYVFVPQSYELINVDKIYTGTFDAATSKTSSDKVYYASQGTTGLEVKDGNISEVYSSDVVGGPYDNEWSW